MMLQAAFTGISLQTGNKSTAPRTVSTRRRRSLPSPANTQRRRNCFGIHCVRPGTPRRLGLRCRALSFVNHFHLIVLRGKRICCPLSIYSARRTSWHKKLRVPFPSRFACNVSWRGFPCALFLPPHMECLFDSESPCALLSSFVFALSFSLCVGSRVGGETLHPSSLLTSHGAVTAKSSKLTACSDRRVHKARGRGGPRRGVRASPGASSGPSFGTLEEFPGNKDCRKRR